MNDQKTNPDADQLFHANREWASKLARTMVYRNRVSSKQRPAAEEEARSAADYGLFQAARSYDGRCEFKTWAFTHVKGQVNDWFRKRPMFGRNHADAGVHSINQEMRSRHGEEFESQLPAVPGHTQEWTREEAKRLIASATAGMPRDQRLILILKFGERLSIKDVAQAVGIGQSRTCQLLDLAIGTVRSRRPDAFPGARVRLQTRRNKERQLTLYGRHYDNAVIRQNELRRLNYQGVAA